MRKYARPPLTILRGAGAGQRSLLKRVTFLQEINAAVAAVLPESAAEHVGVADYRDGELVIIVDSGTWATRLRYQQSQLRRELAQRLRLDLDRLEIRVRPSATRNTAAPVYSREISAGARRQISESARYIENPDLAAALTRLSRSGLP